EAGRTLLKEGIVMAGKIPNTELLCLVEDGLMLLEPKIGPVDYDWMTAVFLHAVVAQTPEQRARAIGWLRKTIPASRSLLPHKVSFACDLTVQFVRLLQEDD